MSSKAIIMLPQEKIKEDLASFWNYFWWVKNDWSLYKKDIKIKLLLEFSNKLINYKKSKQLFEKREKFNKIKYKRHNIASHKKCFICLWQADVRHHIIQLQNGWINSKRNLISLCNSCHKEIHDWL